MHGIRDHETRVQVTSWLYLELSFNGPLEFLDEDHAE